MKLLFTRIFHRTITRQRGLTPDDARRCYQAIEKFRQSPSQPSLRYKRLGRGSGKNHCSIRASDELRVILAVEPDFDTPETVVVANMGHHDAMLRWSERQDYFTSAEDSVDWDSLASPEPTDKSPLWELPSFDEWQLFPHPDQAPLIKRQYAGEARIRGAAGTGKTVVALHRARELGHRYVGEKVLFTTFSKPLTNHLERLYQSLPQAARNVEFHNIDAIAYRMLGESRGWVDDKAVDEAFNRAYQAIVPGTPLERCSPDYLRDEIIKVIKGRGAARDQYLNTDQFERIGRRRKFNVRDRELCWQLMEQWDKFMDNASTPNYADRLIQARNRAIELDSSKYRAAIVDEAQRMTLMGMELVRALVAGKPENPVPPDGLLILDDAAQRIDVGGFRLSWAGLRVTGRSEILQTNYRNSQPIAEAAKSIRGDALLIREDDDDGAAQHVEFEHPRGDLPTFIRVAEGQEPRKIAETIRVLVDEDGIKHEEIAVLTHRNEKSLTIGRCLRAEFDMHWVRLRAQRDKKVRLGKGVRMGTFDCSQGLEFRAVLIPGLGASVFPKVEGMEAAQPALPSFQTEPRELTEEEREARQLDLDRLYVGMTRARERLYLIAEEAPGVEIQRAVDRGLLKAQRLG